MCPPNDESPSGFPETRWTRVLAVQSQAVPEAEAHQALSELCEAYWKPVFEHARRMGLTPEQAEDATQSFFSEVLDRRLIHRAFPELGRFRSFLLGAFKNHVAEGRRSERRLKRGGGTEAIPLDSVLDSELPGLPIQSPELDRLFDRTWAAVLVQRAINAVGSDYSRRGQADVFQRLQPQIGLADVEGTNDSGPADGAERVALFRLRRRFRDALANEVSHTVSEARDIEAEMRHLLCAFAGLESAA